MSDRPVDQFVQEVKDIAQSYFGYVSEPVDTDTYQEATDSLSQAQIRLNCLHMGLVTALNFRQQTRVNEIIPDESSADSVEVVAMPIKSEGGVSMQEFLAKLFSNAKVVSSKDFPANAAYPRMSVVAYWLSEDHQTSRHMSDRLRKAAFRHPGVAQLVAQTLEVCSSLDRITKQEVIFDTLIAAVSVAGYVDVLDDEGIRGTDSSMFSKFVLAMQNETHLVVNCSRLRMVAESLIDRWPKHELSDKQRRKATKRALGMIEELVRKALASMRTVTDTTH